MSQEYTTLSGGVIVYAVLTSSSRLQFCMHPFYLWTNPSKFWKTFLSRLQLIKSRLSHSLRPFRPQIYSTLHFAASVFQKDYACSPPLSPSSRSCSGTSRPLVTLIQGY